MMVLDTSVLAYAVGGDHLLREPCRKIIAAQATGHLKGATTVEVVQEFTHIQARRRERHDATALARDYMASLLLLQTTPEDLQRGLTLFEQHAALGMFDAMLAAVAMNRGADGLISTDTAFGSISGLRWINPATPDLDTILASVGAQAIDLVLDVPEPHHRNE